ncbi:lipoprotein signal peptidase LspA [Paenibacillus sp. JCM 10914]|uniref:signal peptidase II n=1 Tax=Paenibacillus sp. JCM 10914 TaxID=1236974 RepID=UPI0003CC8320|nr:signal peptidase II [Paenibacillus sp. JCM 10914]GAE04287.1 lipoprotein signal peptidase [Paenibacillus sp. JCM 10914]
MVYYLIAFVLFLIDQGTKYLIASRLELYEQIPVIGNFFVITSSRNRGAAFGILQDQLWFFIIVTVIVVGGVIWYLGKMIKEGRKLLPTALALVLGGALGNFIDRLVMGEVVDFLMFNFGNYTFPIFNIADSCIVIGVGLIILDTLLEGRREKLKSASDVSGTEGNE